MLIGREPARERLTAVIGGARAGHGGALLIRGEPGIGKTALVDETVALATDFTTARITGVEGEQTWPYAGLHALIRPFRAHTEALVPVQRAALEIAVGEAGEVGQEPPPPVQVAGGLLALLCRAAEIEPVLIVVDDVQWIDAATQDALAFVARRVADERIAILFAERIDGDDRWAAGPDVLPLEPLATADAVALACSRGAVAPVAQILVEHCGGNPLALVELVAALSDRHRAGTDALPTPLPPTSPEMGYARRLAQLTARTRQATGIAAVCTGASSGALSSALRACGLAASALHPAEAAGLLVLQASGPRWRHPLARAAALRALSGPQRRSAHSAAAEALTQRGCDPDTATWHRNAAEEAPSEDLAGALETVAIRAGGRGARRAEADAWQAAAGAGTDLARRAVRLARAARALLAGDDIEPAEELAQEALTGLSDPGERWSLLMELAAAQAARSTPALAMARYAEARSTAEAAGDRGRQVRSLAAALNASLHLDDPVEPERIAAQIRDLHDPADAVQAFLAGCVQGFAALNAERYAEGLAQLDVALHLCEDGRLLHSDPDLLQTTVQAVMWSGDSLRARESINAAIGTLRRHGQVRELSAVLRGLAWCDYAEGRLELAQVEASESLDLARVGGRSMQVVDTLTVLAAVEGICGNRSEAVARAREATEGARRLQAPWRIADAVWAEVFAHLAAGDARAAATAAAPLTELLVSGHLAVVQPEHLDAAIACAAAGQSEQARAIRDAVTKRTGAGMRPETRAALLMVDYVLAPDDVNAAHALAAEAGALAGAEHAPRRGRMRLLAAATLRRRGERSQARALLREAEAEFVAGQARAWVARTHDELRACGVKVRSGYDEPLTGAEIRVARAVADGMSNREVAASLFVSPKTVEFHLGRVYRKLGVRSRSELVRRMIADSST